MKAAVIGSGIAGLAAAHRLRGHADVTLFEAGDYFGGHTHTVDLTLPDGNGQLVTHGVDTGFLVFNERTYPQLIALFAELRVPTCASDMSFSVQVPRAFGDGPLEWSGSTLASVFSQRGNLLRPRFWRMLSDLLRFNALATGIARSGAPDDLAQPLEDFLRAHGFSREFQDWYLLPMIGCIWSCPTEQMLRFPVGTLIRFCHNHGLLQVTGRPQWHTVRGGARNYVERIVDGIADKRLGTPVLAVRRHGDGVEVRTAGGWEAFDHLVLATHSDQALGLLADATNEERALLGAIRYAPNRAVLHTDRSVLPRAPRAWAAWNYERAVDAPGGAQVCLHYLINRLQPLPWRQPVIVSLNPVRAIDPRRILGAYDYAHPVFDAPAVAAQARLGTIQGQQRTWFAGAWTGYGFHEDGLKSGLAAAAGVLLQAQHQRAVPAEGALA
ncbi:MAG: NAD(P)/FAD-dependent oxidoreductase [Ramlibacter sp.]